MAARLASKAEPSLHFVWLVAMLSNQGDVDGAKKLASRAAAIGLTASRHAR